MGKTHRCGSRGLAAVYAHMIRRLHLLCSSTVESVQVYSVREMGLCLTGTAEVPLAAVYMDQIIPEEQLPIRLAAFGHCFRTEAGSAGTKSVEYYMLVRHFLARLQGDRMAFPAGSASRGLYRVHQFSKVEMFVLSTPAQSEAMLQELCDIEEEIFTELGLHFQMLVRCLTVGQNLLFQIDSLLCREHSILLPAISCMVCLF